MRWGSMRRSSNPARGGSGARFRGSLRHPLRGSREMARVSRKNKERQDRPAVDRQATHCHHPDPAAVERVTYPGLVPTVSSWDLWGSG